MADIKQLERALIKADSAGDADAARVLAAEIRRMRSVPAQQERYDPTEGMSTFEKAAAGVGKAIVDTGRGIGQLFGAVSREDVEEARRLDAALMNTGAGFAGNIAGNIGMALLPGGALKGAGMAANAVNATRAAAPALNAAGSALLAPKSIKGAAAVGTGFGLIQPSTSTTETVLNAGVGGVASAAVPVAVRGFQVARSAAEPFYEDGRNRIVARVMQEVAGDDAPNAVARVREAAAPFVGPSPQGVPVRQTMGEIVPNSMPTVGQISGNPGIAALERTATQTDPVVMNAYSARMGEQNDARKALLERMKGTPKERAAKVDLIEKTARSLYGDAFKESVPVTNNLLRLIGRPSMRRAEARAVNLADELSIPFQATLEDMRPKFIPMGPRTPESSSVVRQAGEYNPYRSLDVPMEEIRVPGQPGLPGYFEVPPVDSVPVRDMHTLKMGMDAMLEDPTIGIAGREGAAIKATRNKLLDMLPESYQKARRSHIELNRPVNQMDIAAEIADKSVDKLTGNMKARAFVNSLTDDTAQQATGLKNATLEGMMEPAQLNALQALANDLQNAAFAQTAGKGAGSDTVQKLAYSNMLAQAGVPNWLRNLAPAQFIGNVAARGADAAYGRANKELSNRLVEALMNPQTAAEMLEANLGNQNRLLALARGGSAAGLTLPWLLNANKE